MRFRALCPSLCALFLVLPRAVSAQADTARSAPIAPLARVPLSVFGASVIVIDSAEIAASTAPTFSELLQARRPGVRVFRSAGMASDGALVLLRGPTSATGPSTPVVIVDGVRVDSRQYDVLLGGPTRPSRLDDLLPEDIERIEILSGAAAALYGDGAANGVLLVTTKSGGQGRLKLSGRTTWDRSATPERFPANYQRLGVSPTTGQPVADCSLIAVEAGQCTPTGLDVWNPLLQASPFHTGNSAGGHLEVGGTALGTSIFAGITSDARQGTLPHDEGSRVGVRGKLGRQLPFHFDLQTSGGYLRDHAHLGSGILTSGLLGSAQNDANRGYNMFDVVTDSLIPDQLLYHATGGAQLHWQPLSWLSAAVQTGRDRFTQHGHMPLAAITTTSPPLPFVDGEFRAYEEHALTTSGARVSASYQLPNEVAATTGLGLDRELLRRSNIDTTIFNGPALSSSQFRDRSTSFWLDQHVALPQGLAVSGALQRVTSSIFGGGAGKEWFPSANLAWAAPIQPRLVSNVRLRAAYAEAAGATEPLGSLTFALVPAFPGPLPPPPKLERVKELEVGGDATFGGSGTVSVTAFRARAMHLWVTSPPQFGGGGTTNGQYAEMTNSGIEVLLNAPLLDSRGVRWTGALSMAMLHNEVTRLTVPPQYTTNDPIVQGYAFGSLWGATYTYADANHDGIIGTNEVQMSQLRYLGRPLPTFESAFTTDLRLPGRVVVSGTLDYRAGNRIWNRTESERCLGRLCRGSQDPTAPLDVQAAAVATRLGAGFPVVGYAEDASFVRLREVAVRWTIPGAITDIIGTRAEVVLAGRNLVTWTKYRGLDPEISDPSPDVLPRQEFFDMPLARQFVLGLDVAPRDR